MRMGFVFINIKARHTDELHWLNALIGMHFRLSHRTNCQYLVDMMPRTPFMMEGHYRPEFRRILNI